MIGFASAKGPQASRLLKSHTHSPCHIFNKSSEAPPPRSFFCYNLYYIKSKGE